MGCTTTPVAVAVAYDGVVAEHTARLFAADDGVELDQALANPHFQRSMV